MSTIERPDDDIEAYHREGRGPSALDGQRLLSDPELIERSRRPGPVQRLRNVWAYRELLRNLVRLQLKVKYKNSVLGFVWSLLNPVLYLVVFTFVFTVVQPTAIRTFPVFLLSGLLCWNLFSTSLGDGTTAIVHNASLVSRVWFPREILTLAGIGAAIVHFFLQLLVLFGALLVFRHSPDWQYLPLLVPALVVMVVLATGLALILGAVNVYLRDTGHLLELVLVAWFWVSCIVYPYQGLRTSLIERGHNPAVTLLNPMTAIVTTFQRVIYNPTPAEKILPPDAGFGWYLRNISMVGVASIVVLFVGLHVFGRLEDNFAEEI